MIKIGFSFIIILFLKNVNTSIVEIPSGKLLGYTNGIYHSFRGIPYAEPPIGILRFEPSRLLNVTWNDIKDVRSPAKTCMRWDPDANNSDPSDLLTGSEDCLYLNVYTPETSCKKLFPVIIYVHGGGFTRLSGDSFNESKIVSYKSIPTVLVTINFRIGPLGYLSTGDSQISGNFGLKDQQLAFKWVKNNIAGFCGDPEQITLLGWSSGGMSIHYHLFNRETKHLIKRAAIISGNIFCPYAISRNPLQNARKMAEYLECPNIETTAGIKQCLKNKPAEDIVGAMKYFKSFISNRYRVFAPVIEPWNVNHSFIIADPGHSLRVAEFVQIPILFSYTKNDSANLAAGLLVKDSNGDLPNMEEFNRNFEKLLPEIFFYNETLSLEEQDFFTSKLRLEYGLEKGKITEEKYRMIEKMFTDFFLKSSTEKSIKMHKKHYDDVYGYIYNIASPANKGNTVSKRDDVVFGAVHSDDINTFMPTPWRTEKPLNTAEEEVSIPLLEMFLNFASTGIPTFNNKPIPKNYGGDDTLKFLEISEGKVGELFTTTYKKNV